ncbi:FliM/FliN family flagellar motor switch protein [Actibacterium lipolyticum]|uniref:Flagellar motor switch protein FliM n=1 Tax=Actibacterium lipolyticum TaxID=1524263 RepID=A0A238KJI4_9RHOB|nr:FliM/FliN family flagellar motor switch protein [Actibacterium lipolyticum]SMX42995.1 flagellar motor switch protein FliM [Actibacterium lipolyticum]
MLDEPQPSVLKRKLSVGQSAPVAPGVDLRSFRASFPRAAQKDLGLRVSVTEAADSFVDLDGLDGLVDGHDFVGLLVGPNGRAGLVVLSVSLLGAVVGQRMTGQVPPPSGERKPTRIDAEMARGCIDRALAEFETAFDGVGNAGWAKGFRYDGYIADTRLIRFSLPEARFRVLRLTLDIADGTRSGTITLALPEVAAQKSAPAKAGADTDWAGAMRSNVMVAEVQVDAVLARLKLPLRQLMNLQVGQVLHLPNQALSAVRLEASEGTVVATGRLGQSRGDRAVRIELGAPPIEKGAPEKDAPVISTDIAVSQ